MSLCLLAGSASNVQARQTTPPDLVFHVADVDFDGDVDDDDVYLVSDGYVAATTGGVHPSTVFTFFDGDITRDGKVDISDFMALGMEYPTTSNDTPITPMAGITLATTSNSMGGVIDNDDPELLVLDNYGTPTGNVLLNPNLASGLFNPNHMSIWYAPSVEPVEDPECEKMEKCDPIYTPPEHCEPEIEVVSVTDGFDLKVTWTNTSETDPKSYGVIRIPFIDFGPQVYARDFTRSSEERLITLDSPNAEKNLGSYPGNKYSPCLTVRGFVADANADASEIEDWPNMDPDAMTPETGVEDYMIAIGQDDALDAMDMVEASKDLGDFWLGEAHTRYAEPSAPQSGMDDAYFREYVMGVSLQYPVPIYEFSTQFFIAPVQITSGGVDSIYWFLTIEPNPRETPKAANGQADPNVSHTEHPEAGLLPPDSERHMTVSVRFYRPLSWYEDVEMAAADSHRGTYLNLFREYRRYFKKAYGGVQHTSDRDTRPIKRLDFGSITGNGNCPTEPYGFATGNQISNLPDPDWQGGIGWEFFTNGNPSFPSTVTLFERFEGRGFYRLIIQGASGNHCDEDYVETLNWPFDIYERWTEIAEDNPPDPEPMGYMTEDHPILSTLDALGVWDDAIDNDPSTCDEEREVGFWWGRSVQPTQYDGSGNLEEVLLDIALGTYGRSRAISEIFGMGEAGVTSLGLDQSIALPEWNRYRWLKILSPDYFETVYGTPHLFEKFYTEGYAPDFVHTLQPTYFQMSKTSPNLRLPGGPHAMIDFLNQGAETWGAIGITTDSDGNPMIDTEGDVRTNTDAHDAARTLAKRGFTVGFGSAWDGGSGFVDVSDGGCGVDGDFIASDSWLKTVPVDLREP